MPEAGANLINNNFSFIFSNQQVFWETQAALQMTQHSQGRRAPSPPPIPRVLKTYPQAKFHIIVIEAPQ